MSNSTGRLSVDRLNVTYLIPRDHPDPDGLRTRLDETARSGLCEVCGRLLSQALSVCGPSVWLIRHLEMDLTLDVGAFDDGQLAQAWGRQFANGIARAIGRGADGENVLHFANRVEYLAEFVRDLAAERAWGKWYYEAFDSLRTLPTHVALREALTREPELTRAILLCLNARSQLPPVLAALRPGDALRVLDVWAAGSTASTALDGYRELIEGFLSVWERAGLDTQNLATPANALRLLLTLDTQAPRLASDGRARSAAEQLLAFAEVLRSVPQPRALLECMASGDQEHVLAWARLQGITQSLAGIALLTRYANGDADWLGQLASKVCGHGAVVAALPHSMPEGRVFTSRFGGLFLLLPGFIDSGMSAAIEAAPYPERGALDTKAVLRYFVALKCFGRARSEEALLDPVLALAVGFEGLPDMAALRAAVQETTLAMDQELSRLVLQALVEGRRVQGRYLLADRLEILSLGTVLLIRDLAQDAWAYAECASTRSELMAALARGLAVISQATGSGPEFLVCGDGLDAGPEELGVTREHVAWLERVNSRQGSNSVCSVSYGGAPALLRCAGSALPGDAVCSLLRSVRQPGGDMEYLTLTDLPSARKIPPSFDLVGSLLARTTLCAFSERLIGFHRSSAEYLYRNFIEGSSTIQWEADRVLVQFDPRPLQLVLHLAGVDGQRYTPPWHHGTNVTLTLAGSS